MKVPNTMTAVLEKIFSLKKPCSLPPQELAPPNHSVEHGTTKSGKKGEAHTLLNHMKLPISQHRHIVVSYHIPSCLLDHILPGYSWSPLPIGARMGWLSPCIYCIMAITFSFREG